MKTRKKKETPKPIFLYDTKASQFAFNFQNRWTLVLLSVVAITFLFKLFLPKHFQELFSSYEQVVALFRPVNIWRFVRILSMKPITPYVAIIVYFSSAFVSRRFFPVLRDGPKYKWLSFSHNFILFVESIWLLYGFVRFGLLPLMAGKIAFLDGYCNLHNTFQINDTIYTFGFYYYLSKYHEMFDTAILILRGKQLSWLALFHHSIMVPVAYNAVAENDAGSAFHSALLNCFIHVIMYGYFALTALGINLNFIRKYLTTMQITQFILIILYLLPRPFLHHSKMINYAPCSSFLSWLWINVPVFCIMLFFMNFYYQQYQVRVTRVNLKKGQ